MSRPYRPSNGSEGFDFEEQWCARCSRDAAFRKNPHFADGCPIIGAAQIFQIGEAGYPEEWIEDEKGPRCTAFTIALETAMGIGEK